ncbi:MAG TPA: PD-(D/E)XK nuclease family protein [Caulobacteraceae bacterium]|jgi:hypothetical protein
MAMATTSPDGSETSLGSLLDDPEFGDLDRRLGRFNLFEAVGGVRAELRHSNFLGFLLSPGRSHGLGPLVLERMLRAMLEEMTVSDRPIRTLSVALGDLDDATVHRERDNIDLLIEVPSLGLVVTIENKVGAAPGDGQLARYKEIVEHRFASHKHLFVLLTPEGIDPESRGWIPFSYRRLAELLTGVSELESVSDGPRLILNHYVEMLRRHVVPDDELRALALRLYERHREAFDFVFDVRPQPKSVLEDLKSQILSVQGLIEDRPGASVVNIFRFLPVSWDQTLTKLACDPQRWSKTGRGLLFEAKAYPTGRVHIILVLGPCEPKARKAFYEQATKRPAFKGLVKSMGQVTATVYNRELLTPAQAQTLTFEQQAANVSLAWSDFQGKELVNLVSEIEAIAAGIG